MRTAVALVAVVFILGPTVINPSNDAKREKSTAQTRPIERLVLWDYEDVHVGIRISDRTYSINRNRAIVTIKNVSPKEIAIPVLIDPSGYAAVRIELSDPIGKVVPKRFNDGRSILQSLAPGESRTAEIGLEESFEFRSTGRFLLKVGIAINGSNERVIGTQRFIDIKGRQDSKKQIENRLTTIPIERYRAFRDSRFHWQRHPFKMGAFARMSPTRPVSKAELVAALGEPHSVASGSLSNLHITSTSGFDALTKSQPWPQITYWLNPATGVRSSKMSLNRIVFVFDPHSHQVDHLLDPLMARDITTRIEALKKSPAEADVTGLMARHSFITSSTCPSLGGSIVRKE